MKKESNAAEKELVKQEPAGGLSLAKPSDLGFGAADDISATDIKIERIMLTQSMSKKVQSDEVEKGKLVIQSTLEELGSYKPGVDLEFIPIKSMRYWVETDKDTQEFITRYPGISPDEHEFEEVRGGRTIKRTYTHSFIVILPKQIATMEDVPLEFAFRSTNLACAQSINLKLVNMKKRNLSSWMKVFKVKIDTKTNAKGTWYITVDSISRDPSQEEIAAAESWVKVLSSANVKLDDDSEGDGGSASNLPPLNQEEQSY